MAISNNASAGHAPRHTGLPAHETEDAMASISGIMRYFVSLVRRNFLAIGAIIGAFVALAIVLTLLDTPKYSAQASVQINDQSDKVLGDDLDTQTNVNTTWDVERFLNTQLEILQSREVAERVARKLNLYNDTAFFAAVEAELPEDDADQRTREEVTFRLLRANLGVDLPFETRIVRISFTTTDPQLSAKIANAFAEEFIQSNLQRRFDSSSYARGFIAEQLEQARAELESSERELNAYARQAGLIRSRGSLSNEDGNISTSVTTDSLGQLNMAANKARAERIAAEARWRAESSQPLMSSPTVQSSLTVQDLLTERAKVDAQIETLRARYLDDYPPITQLKAQRESLDVQIQQVARSVRDGVRAEYLAAAEAESRLRGQVDQLQGATMAEQDRAVRYNTLAREADTNRSIYEGLLQRYRELNASAGIAASNLAIIDRAVPPLFPSSPSLPKNLFVALILGLFFAGGFVFLRDQLDDAIRVPEDVENKVHVPLLGVIPYSGEEDLHSELLDPKSPVSEAYNSLRGALLYSTSEGLPRVIQVTSAEPGEGKSTTSMAIARGLARTGKRVVLVDADLRRPSVHKRLGVENREGLSTLLTSHRPVQDIAIADADEANFSYLTSGPLPPSPTELLSSPRFAAVLEEMLAVFDNVVLDGPPVLGLADAPVMSALADGLVIVIEADRGRHGVLKTSLRRLRAMNPTILGGVLTKFDPEKGGNRYSSYYGYEYYRYQHADEANR